MKKRDCRNRGFSLIELIVTVTILAIIMLPLMRAFLVSTRTNAKAKAKLRATEAAQNILEIFEAKSLDELTAYFAGADDGLFGETDHALLGWHAETGAFAEVSRTKDLTSPYYFALSGINGKSALVTVTASDSKLADDQSLNDRELVSISTINASCDAIYSVSKTADTVAAAIQNQNPDIGELEQSDISRSITISIESVTDALSGETSIKVTADCSYRWAKGEASGSYPSGGTSSVIFDNATDTGTELSGIYLFYAPWYTSNSGRLSDVITINNKAQRAVDVYLIKQLPAAGSAAESRLLEYETAYRVKVNVNEPVSGSQSTTKTRLRSNLMTNLSDNTAITGSQAVLALNGVIQTAGGETVISHEDLTAAKAKERLFDIRVDIFPSDSYAGYAFADSDIYMTFTGSKAE